MAEGQGAYPRLPHLTSERFPAVHSKDIVTARTKISDAPATTVNLPRILIETTLPEVAIWREDDDKPPCHRLERFKEALTIYPFEMFNHIECGNNVETSGTEPINDAENVHALVIRVYPSGAASPDAIRVSVYADTIRNTGTSLPQR